MLKVKSLSLHLLFQFHGKVTIEGLISNLCIIDESPSLLWTLRYLSNGSSLCISLIFEFLWQELTTHMIGFVTSLFSLTILTQRVFQELPPL